MNNTPPSNTPNRTPQGQRPTQGQAQRPAQGGQRPMQGGQRPMQSGQRPMQSGQRPMQSGQRPMQSGQRPMQSGQRPTQGQMRPSAPHGPTGSNFDTKKLLTVAIIVTAVLLIVSIIIATAALAFSGALDGIFDKPDTSYVDDGKDKPSKETQKIDENDPTIVNASITLPVATPSGSYLAGYSTTCAEISGISSAAAVLLDVSSGSVTASKQADTRIYPASMTKVMTLLVACENATTAGKLLTVEQWMIDYQQGMGASGIMGFKAGEQIRLEDALYLINYNSDTIACLLVANHVSGSEAAFVELMNQKARALGLMNTHFTNTTGLHNDDHYTTCREMAAIMNCAMNNPIASKIITSHGGRGVSVYTNNTVSRNTTIYASWYSDEERFSDNNGSKYDNTIYTDIKGKNGTITVIGGKTGYEDIPTACFVTVAENKNGNKYICVTVGRISNSQSSIDEVRSTLDTIAVYKNYT